MSFIEGREYAKFCHDNNLPIKPNQTGISGETMLGCALSYLPLFNVYFLDGKAPSVDFFCELLDEEKPYPFLIQVKATTQGTNKDGNLIVDFPENKQNALLNRPLPTYLAGVDLNKCVIYLYPIFDPSDRVTSIPATLTIDLISITDLYNGLNKLKKDIIFFWETNSTNKTTYKSKLL